MSKLIIVVRPAPGQSRLPEILSWIRRLVPTALLLVAPVQLPEVADLQVVQIECSDELDGPLAVARTLAGSLPR